ncbi:MAG: uracil phosphoribosyltransferase [Bacteroidia bacterium]|nr:uracil phosphoribosyltransferase [Bacteroidia bacterium]MCZ2277134.1 uracil phosphoribosyltransferase [Bacteroidia bacterium]
MIHILSEHNSIICQYIAEIRDVQIQNDRMRFRRNLERIGEFAAVEISKTMEYVNKEVITPLGTATVPVLKEQPIIATILRAGLPLHQGVLNYFDHADNAFISAYRRHHKDGSFEISLEYVSSPGIDGRILILTDPMLATGQSMVKTIRALFEKGKPAKLHIITTIASMEGIEYLRTHLSHDFELWVAAVDEELTAQAYIVPGLGDAGDLAFGEKS